MAGKCRGHWSCPSGHLPKGRQRRAGLGGIASSLRRSCFPTHRVPWSPVPGARICRGMAGRWFEPRAAFGCVRQGPRCSQLAEGPGGERQWPRPRRASVQEHRHAYSVYSSFSCLCVMHVAACGIGCGGAHRRENRHVASRARVVLQAARRGGGWPCHMISKGPMVDNLAT